MGSAFDPADPFHDDSVAVFRAATERGLSLAGPAYVVLESVCAQRRVRLRTQARTESVPPTYCLPAHVLTAARSAADPGSSTAAVGTKLQNWASYRFTDQV